MLIVLTLYCCSTSNNKNKNDNGNNIEDNDYNAGIMAQPL